MIYDQYTTIPNVSFKQGLPHRKKRYRLLQCSILVGGPLVSWIIGALESAVSTGGITVLGGAMTSIAIPHDSVIQYEKALKANKSILIVLRPTEEVEKS